MENEGAAGFEFWLRFWRWVVTLEQVFGGLFGVYVVASGRGFATSPLFFLLGIAFFLLSIIGGVLLARNNPQGAIISLAVQGIQLIQISTSGLLFFFVCGTQVLLGFYPSDIGTDLGFAARLSSGFFFLLNPPAVAGPQTDATGIGTGGSADAITGINVVAVLAIICLLYVRASYRKSAAVNT